MRLWCDCGYATALESPVLDTWYWFTSSPNWYAIFCLAWCLLQRWSYARFNLDSVLYFTKIQSKSSFVSFRLNSVRHTVIVCHCLAQRECWILADLSSRVLFPPSRGGGSLHFVAYWIRHIFNRISNSSANGRPISSIAIDSTLESVSRYDHWLIQPRNDSTRNSERLLKRCWWLRLQTAKRTFART